MTEIHSTPSHTTLGLRRCAMAGAFATLGLFVLGWGWTATGLPGGNAFVGLFTVHPAGSLAALGLGGLCAFLSGGVAGTLVAHCYNLAGRVLGR